MKINTSFFAKSFYVCFFTFSAHLGIAIDICTDVELRIIGPPTVCYDISTRYDIEVTARPHGIFGGCGDRQRIKATSVSSTFE